MANRCSILRWAWWLGILCLAAEAQIDSLIRRPSSVPTRSRSGQFLVVGGSTVVEEPSAKPVLVPAGSQRSISLTPLRPLDSQSLSTLSPPLLSVSCERIKAEVLRILKIEDRFVGSMVVRIVPVNARETPARIQANQYADGWRYTLELQSRIHWTLLVRTVAEALLLEIANRGNGGQLNPIPLWMSEGITMLLIGEASRELVPQLNREFKDPLRSMDPFVAISAKIAGRAPLGFESLAFPSDDLLNDTNRFQWFQGSSALLVHQLRQLGGTPVSLGALVLTFNQTLNWQTALLRAYGSEFQSLLDVEKWWAVQATAFYARNASRILTVEILDRQLRSVFQETVEVAPSTNSPPGRRVIRLSEALEQWPYVAQSPVLQRKITQLSYLADLGARYRSRPPGGKPDPELILRFDQASRGLSILEHYQRERGNPTGGRRNGELDPRIRVVVRGAVARLRPLESDVLSGL